jgi:hypothetical protein
MSFIGPSRSAIIQEVKGMYAAGLATLAYYYLDFWDVIKQDCYGLLSSLLYDQQVIDVRHSSIVRKTYVFHKSTRVTPAFHSVNALLLKKYAAVPLCRAFETKLLSADPGKQPVLNVLLQLVLPVAERCSTLAGHLQNTSVVSATKGEEKQQTFHLVHFVWWLVKSDNALKTVKVIPVLRETHAGILSNTTRRCLSI